MGLIWNLIQQSQISEQANRAGTLEERVSHLEKRLDATQDILHRLLEYLEPLVNKDIDGDGRIGK